MTIRLIFLSAVAGFFINAASAQDIVDEWRYTIGNPGDGWQTDDFDDSKWTEGFGGFGTWGTPGSRVGTNWDSKDIWLRKSFPLKSIPDKPALLIHHDEDVVVFINGKQVASLQGYQTEYEPVRLQAEGQSALKVGVNVMAVHCRQTTGGQFVDVHLIDADNVPKLPRPKNSLKPFQSELITDWGAKVTAENAWQEYPRPQLRRDNWQNLNGNWEYAVTEIEQNDTPKEWSGQILVPFCLESKLGCVGRMLDATEALWYRRSFETEKPEGQRMLLNFEAVDYRCEVFVNGKSVGKHVGGNTPFSFDITDAAVDGENELVVRVEDETEGWQLRGKQVIQARGIWYTQVSGIWQTVWLEHVPETYLADVKITTDAGNGVISVWPMIEGTAGAKMQILVKDGDNTVVESLGNPAATTIILPSAKLWSPQSPHLYDLEITLWDAGGKQVDSVKSYCGVRSVGKTRDKDGHVRFTLNSEPIFHWGPLDQGWWPDGLLTPPSDEAMRFDIEYLKTAGFNMIRKHIKVEPRRYYYHCDKIGMMVWQDHVSGGKNPPWTRLKPDPEDAQWPDEHHQQFMIELARMIHGLENHPSIVVWVPFNEAWGQHRTIDVAQYLGSRDRSRLVNVASGGNFWPVGDIVDHHSYPNPDFPFDPSRYKDFIKVIGEFGGHGYPVRNHLWDANRNNWGYGGLPENKEEYQERYVKSLNMLNDLRKRGIAGGVYTQTTDVEGEINGLMTYDRKVQKIPAKELAELHRRLFELED